MSHRRSRGVRFDNRFARLPGRLFHPGPADAIAGAVPGRESRKPPAPDRDCRQTQVRRLESSKLWPAIGLSPAANRSPRFIQATSSACTCPRLGDGRALLLGEVDRSGWRASGNCSSKVLARPPIRAWATAARCCARRFANSSPRRRCMGCGIPTTRALAVTGSDSSGHARNRRDRGGRHSPAPSFVRFGIVRVLLLD